MSGPVPGLSKAALAARHVRRVNPWSDLARFETDLAALTPGSLGGFAAAIVAVDNDAARLRAAQLLMAVGVPYVDAGVRADLSTARVTVCRPAPDAPCLLDAWSEERLARAGFDVGRPCAAVGDVPPYGSSLAMAQGAAAVAVHQLMQLTGVLEGAAAAGAELRLDLRSLRLERFALPHNPSCAAAHALAPAARVAVAHQPSQTSLVALMASAGASAASHVVPAGSDIVTSAFCRPCGTATRPMRPANTLLPCPTCGGALAPLRRSREIPWGEAAATLDGLPASVWFQPGDVFGVRDPSGGTRQVAFPPVAIPWDRGRPFDAATDADRFVRAPEGLDLERVRRTRLAVLGLGHLGAAVLEALAPLPWAGLLLLDRDRLELANVQSHALAAAHPEGAP